MKVVIFVINLAIVVYLVYAKRLFGLRGGAAAEQVRRAAASSWAALEAIMPVPAQSETGARS